MQRSATVDSRRPVAYGSPMASPSRPIATFDLTARCPLRCLHCYFFAAPPGVGDLDDGAWVARLVRLRDRWGIRSAFWVGGEPLLRLGLLRKAMFVFDRNAVATSGAVPIPSDLDAGLLVSVDGLREEHERLRGPGTFDRVLSNLRPIRKRSFALSTTITSATLSVVDDLDAMVERTGALGVLVGLHVGPLGDPLRVAGDDRDRVVDRLLDVAARRPGLVLNSSAALDRFRPVHAADVAAHCIYRSTAIAFDTRLRRKRPCTFGARADCSACGCPVVAEQRMRDLGLRASTALLKALFPRAQPRA